jgi:hypothetical protein
MNIYKDDEMPHFCTDQLKDNQIANKIECQKNFNLYR